MNEAVQAVMGSNADIDWKEFSRKLMFEGMVPALKMLTDASENKIDDVLIEIADKAGHAFLPEQK